MLSIADSNHQSAELIGSNDDLLTEILRRLPVKFILRFKSVCKQWLSLLTHPRFTLLFDKFSISSGLYYHELHVPFDVENPTLPPFRPLDFYADISSLDSSPEIDRIRIVQSCNGLLLCCYEAWPSYYVFNPTTKKLAAIPPIIGACYRRMRLMGLAYHPTECVHYKLVCILRVGEAPLTGYDEINGQRMYYIQIYSSQTGKWKKLSQTFTPLCYSYFRYGVYWNRAFHWVPSCCNPMYLRLDNEEIQDLPLPSPLPVRFPSSAWSYYMPLYFGESQGHLHLVDSADNKNHLNINVYEMLRDHSGWFIKYQLDLSELCAAYPNMVRDDEEEEDKYDFRVLDVVRGEEEEDTFMVVKVVDNIKRYNILDKSFLQLFSIPNNDYEDGQFFLSRIRHTQAHRYIEKIGSF